MVVKEEFPKEVTFKERPEGLIRVNWANGTAEGGEEAEKENGYRDKTSEGVTLWGTEMRPIKFEYRVQIKKNKGGECIDASRNQAMSILLSCMLMVQNLRS